MFGCCEHAGCESTKQCDPQLKPSVKGQFVLYPVAAFPSKKFPRASPPINVASTRVCA
jgi:hypothetical protein